MSKKQIWLWTLFVIGMIGMVGALAIGPAGVIAEQAVTWAIFCYAMYDFYNAASGEKKLARTGIHGQAEVLTAEQTNTQWATGQADYMAPFAWRYKLKVTLPGKAPYETQLLTLEHFHVGQVIAVSAKRNHLKHVAYDPNGTVQGGTGGTLGLTKPGREARLAQVRAAARAGGVQVAGDGGTMTWTVNGTPGGSEVDVADEIAKLAELRDKGILTSDEFDQRKAKLLAG